MNKTGLLALVIAAGILFGAGGEAEAQDGYIGEVRLFAGTFAPRGWAFCDGQLLAIEKHSALFSLLGTTYGGDARTTFGLPDLRGRVPVHAGQGPGLAEKKLGQKSGAERATLRETKEVAAKTDGGEGVTVVGEQDTGLGQPSLALNYIICLHGVYPSRN